MEQESTASIVCCEAHCVSKSDIISTPVLRKALSQIGNIGQQNYGQSPTLFNRSRGTMRKIQECKEDNLKDTYKENIEIISPTQFQDGSKSSSCSTLGNFSHHFLSELNKGSCYYSGFTTPSPAQRQPNTCRTLGMLSNEVQKQYTPKDSLPQRYNPFEECAEVLQLPTVSPSLFREVVSPSAKEDEKFAWAIDHLALLHPTNIEVSPCQETEIPMDPEYEKKAQDAIDRFFSSTLVVPSPWANNGSQGLSIMSTILSSGSDRGLPVSTASTSKVLASHEVLDKDVPSKIEDLAPVSSKLSTVWCQTELSLPPILPKELEAALAPFCTFAQDQLWQQEEEGDEATALNTTSLRRKLLFSDDVKVVPQYPDEPRPRSAEVATSCISDCGSSPASTGPLPLDEEEIPWGVSMIRPTSRLSIPGSPSSPTFHHSSGRRVLSPSSSSSSSNGFEIKVSQGEVAAPGASPNTVSPITYIAPKGFRTLPSPTDCFQTPSRRGFLPSPKLSPICKYSPCTPQSMTKVSSRHKSGSPRGSHNEEELQTPPLLWSNKRGNHFTGPSEDPKLDQQEQGKLQEALGGVPLPKEKGVGRITPLSARMQVTPQVKEATLRSTSKTSPHFSSSPIKRGGSSTDSYDGSTCPFDLTESDKKACENSPKLDESPAVSPISWRCDYTASELWSRKGEASGSFVWPQSSRVGSFINTAGESMEDIIEEGKDIAGISSPSLTSESFVEHRLKQVTCERSLMLPEVVMQTQGNVTLMDIDAHNFLEGSLAGEVSCGHDTGYHTGSYLQTTNQSNSFPTSSLSQTKEPKSPVLRNPFGDSQDFAYPKEATELRDKGEVNETTNINQ